MGGMKRRHAFTTLEGGRGEGVFFSQHGKVLSRKLGDRGTFSTLGLAWLV
jgi:hypothetical protein